MEQLFGEPGSSPPLIQYSLEQKDTIWEWGGIHRIPPYMVIQGGSLRRFGCGLVLLTSGYDLKVWTLVD